MELANAPSKIVLPFAADGGKNVIPVPSQIPITPGAASWTDGFPPDTMLDSTEGGVGPSGLDFNGVFNAISAISLWGNAGGSFPYDATFSAAIGGYPKGAQVLRADGRGFWLSVVDDNSSDPDTGGAGWVMSGNKPVASVYASAAQNLAVGGSKVLFDTVEFDDYGLWNAASKRYVIALAGKYRVSGCVMLTAPASQFLGVAIAQNGVQKKVCAQYGQITDANMSFPFDAIINCAAGDYIEIQMNVQQTIVSAGSGINTFAQIEGIG